MPMPRGDGISLQLEPSERSDLSGKVRLHPSRLAIGIRSRMPHTSTDATRQCILQISRNGDDDPIKDCQRTVIRVGKSLPEWGIP